MSRWHTEFEQHAFQSSWRDLQSEVALLEIDDPTIQTSVDEIGRLKRVIAYLAPMVANIDAELTPRSIWDQFQSQVEPCLDQIRQFVSNRNIGHIQNANAHADNLLAYVRPFMVLPVRVVEGISLASKSYRVQLEQAATKVMEKSSSVVESIQSNVEKIEGLRTTAIESQKQIEELLMSIFVGSSERPATKSKIEELAMAVEAQAEGVKNYHEALLVDGDTPSMKSDIDAAIKKIQAGRERVEKDLKAEASALSKISTFHDKIFGVSIEGGLPVGGLKAELDERASQLTKLEKEQIVKHNALYNQIETLLPGATSAGLATSYKTLRHSFDDPITINTRVFYIAVGLMPVLALIACVQYFSLWPFEIQFIQVPTYEAILRHMLAKVPFVLPLIWLAIFALRRRGQYERLQQEYAHKEALAASYESYKTQLSQLQVPDTDSLKKELIAKAIEAIAFNVSTTLSEAPTEKMPLDHALETLNGDKGLLSFLGKLKDNTPKSA